MNEDVQADEKLEDKEEDRETEGEEEEKDSMTVAEWRREVA